MATHYPAIATHDPAMIDLARRWSAERGVGSDRFEFQMLYGIRRDSMLVKEGFLVRCISRSTSVVPYHAAACERPANVWFVGRSILSER
jgi:proline dehydrogenase